MKASTENFIDGLASDLKPGRHWHPAARAFIWACLFTAISVFGMLWYQPFRPQFFNQLLEHSRFGVEMVSAFLVVNCFIYCIFISLVPGRKIPKSLLGLSLFAITIWSISFYLSFQSASPPASPVGARSYCVEEVAVYGIIGILFFFYFVRKTFIPVPRSVYFLMGVTAGLVPGALMQIACAYFPMHGLLVHYMPALVVGLLAAVVMPLIQKK